MSSTTNMSESTRPADQTAAHQNSQYARIDRIISNGDINCSICISPLSIILEALPHSHPLLQTTDATVTCAGFITLPCGHHFGRTCILTWLHHSGRANTNTTSRPTCPLCRARVPRRHAASTTSNSTSSTSSSSSSTTTSTPTPIPDPAHLAARLDRIDAIAKALADDDDEQQSLLALHTAPLQQAARRLEALLRAAPGRAAQLTRGSPVPAEAGRLARLLGAVCEATAAATTMRAGGLADAVVGAMWAEDAAEAEARGEVQVVDGQVVLDVMRFVERMVAMILLEEGEEDSGEEEDWETNDDGEEEEDYEADDEIDEDD
ncbi:hypothetical protein NpPPO83_00012379 [Neofusicoccum parvum]|uniref:Uncharacterized protein n=1 Tax=Neofusicoccum parvum TaxID=310453 RepID=A0ACB5RNK2_9PEZI|nr:hypothetical protein NpPPO83_00012379 [Neofusicoccum parvum]